MREKPKVVTDLRSGETEALKTTILEPGLKLYVWILFKLHCQVLKGYILV